MPFRVARPDAHRRASRLNEFGQRRAVSCGAALVHDALPRLTGSQKAGNFRATRPATVETPSQIPHLQETVILVQIDVARIDHVLRLL